MCAPFAPEVASQNSRVRWQSQGGSAQVAFIIWWIWPADDLSGGSDLPDHWASASVPRRNLLSGFHCNFKLLTCRTQASCQAAKLRSIQQAKSASFRHSVNKFGQTPIMGRLILHRFWSLHARLASSSFLGAHSVIWNYQSLQSTIKAIQVDSSRALEKFNKFYFIAF